MGGDADRRPGRRLAWPSGWLAGRTLRGRLIAGLVALLALSCGAVGAATYVALHGFLLGGLDQQLKDASKRYEFCLHPPSRPDHSGPDEHRPPPGLPGDCGKQAAPQTFSATVTGGRVHNCAVANGSCRLSPADVAALAGLPAGRQPYTRTLSWLGTYRLLAVRGGHGVDLSGLPLSQVQTTLRRVELTELLVFSAALLLAGVIGTGWVRLSLRPLRRITATAAQVTELPLASGEVDLPHRVPDDDPRTEVGQLGAAFNRMLGHVESALARRHASEARLRNFAADASHELRTPLAAIRGYAELARRHPGPTPADVGQALRRVEAEAARMGALVDDLLLLARLDAGRPLASAPVDLARLSIDATSDARAAGPGHRWVLELPDEPVLVTGDPGRLHQVLANVLSNARTHTPPGTTVTVSLAAGGTARAPVRLTVTDDGPGIPAELRDGLFERFVRGDSSRSRASGGTGLGLSIVEAVVAAHQGTVRVSSRPGHTSFVIELPALGPSAGAAETWRPAGQPGTAHS